MAKGKKRNIVSHLLRRWFPLLAALLSLAVWVSLVLAMRPLPESDGRLGKNPFGIVTSYENRALDMLFQLRDALRPETRGRGRAEPITIIKVDEESIRRSNIRLQMWPRDYYAVGSPGTELEFAL